MNLTEIVQSAGWKNFMAKLYGIGASVVIVGAMFKIQHWPGGGTMITAGLTVEAVIFFFSAFEPLHEELDWTLVYPELAGMTDPDELDDYKDEALAGRGVTLEKFDDLFNQGDIKPETIKKLGDGLNSLANTAANLSDISSASMATKQYAENVQNAAESVGGLVSNYGESTSKLASAAGTLSDSYEKASDLINKGGAEVAASYSSAATKMQSDINLISQGNQSFGGLARGLNQRCERGNHQNALVKTAPPAVPLVGTCALLRPCSSADVSSTPGSPIDCPHACHSCAAPHRMPSLHVGPRTTAARADECSACISACRPTGAETCSPLRYPWASSLCACGRSRLDHQC